MAQKGIKKIFFSIVLLFIAGCNKNAKVERTRNDLQLQLYNDVLDELVKRHFYGRYLGEEELDALYRKHVYNRQSVDSVTYYT